MTVLIPHKRIIVFFICLGIIILMYLYARLFSSPSVPATPEQSGSLTADTELTQYSDRVGNVDSSIKQVVPSSTGGRAPEGCALSLGIATQSAAGERRTYQITVFNAGTIACTGSSLSLYYPDGETVIAVSPPARSADYYWNFGTLTSGQKTLITVTTARPVDTDGKLEGCLSAGNGSDACTSADATPAPVLPTPPATTGNTIPLPPVFSGGTTIPRIAGREAGIWVWDFVEDMSNAQMSSMVNAAAANGATALYLTIDQYLTRYYLPVSAARQESIAAYERSLSAFVSIAQKKGIAVDAVAGWRDWAVPEKRDKALAIIQFVAGFNATHADKVRAVQFDVEPYLLPQYEGDKATVLAEYVAFADQMQKTAAASGIKLSLVIPHFYDAAQAWTPEITYGGRMAYTFNHLLSIMNRGSGNTIILMTYRNFAQGDNGTIQLAQKEIADAQASRGSTKIIVAQETGAVEPDYVTFAGMSRQQLFTQIDIINQAFGTAGSYGGIAIHYLTPFLALR